MTTARSTRTARIIPLLIAFCFVCLPAVAQYSGGSGTADDPYQIATAEDLMLLGETPQDYDKHFILTADIDLDPNLPGRQVFAGALIGCPPAQVGRATQEADSFQGTPFTGVLDGNDHEIRNLVIEIPRSTQPYLQNDYVGLIAWVGEKGLVKRLGLAKVNIDAGNAESVGGLAGENRGTILSCYSLGHVTAWGRVGGLVGGQYTGTITSCHSAGSVKGIRVGGLVGLLWTGTMSSCYSTASVEKGPQISDMIGTFEYAGGLVGRNYDATISCCYASGDVTADVLAGGLVGTNNNGTIRSCYSSGKVTGHHHAGGLVASNGGRIVSCYATGDVSGRWDVGGLAGGAGDGSIATSYSVGKVTPVGAVTRDTPIGGLVAGDCSTSPCLSYWNLETSGLASSAAGEGKTTQEMMSLATFAGWGHDAQWTLDEGKDYPRLVWEGRPGLPITDPPRTYSGGTGDSSAPYLLRTAEDVICFGRFPGDWGAAFALGNDIDLARIHPDEVLRIGTRAIPFAGTFDGQGCTVRGLRVESVRGRCLSRVGMFGCVGPSGVVRHLHLADVDIVGEDYVGGLVGSNEGTVLACSVTGRVTASNRAGGVAGENKGTVVSSGSTCTVLGSWMAGGLIGENSGEASSCYAMGTAQGNFAGGLAGKNSGAMVQCYSAVTAVGRWRTGGLFGQNDPEYGSATDCFWDTKTWLPTPDDVGTGKTTAEMQMASTFLEAGWDFVGETENGTDDVWWILEGRDYPRLWWELPTEYVVLVVDDFESYSNKHGSRPFEVWIDGLGFLLPEPGHLGNGTNALVGHFWCDPPHPGLPTGPMETTIVYGGRQSMPLYYDNTFEPYYSEAERTFTTPSNWTPDAVATPQDWTAGGADALTLHIHGRADNPAEPLYVVLEDSAGNVAVVRHPDAEAVLVTEWQKWHISLADLQAAGVDVASVAKMIIGIGNRDDPEPGGEGMIYIDDIILTKRMP